MKYEFNVKEHTIAYEKIVPVIGFATEPVALYRSKIL